MKQQQNQAQWTLNHMFSTLQWLHNERDGVSNHQPHDCLINRLFRCRSKKTSKLRVAGLCVGNSPVTGEFPAQMASSEENVSIRWRHHDLLSGLGFYGYTFHDWLMGIELLFYWNIIIANSLRNDIWSVFSILSVCTARIILTVPWRQQSYYKYYKYAYANHKLVSNSIS